MKYKKYRQHLATGALAISLLVSGSSVFAATPQDLGLKNTQPVYQKQNKLKIKKTGKSNTIGIVGAINASGFTLEVKNLKTKITSSVDIQTNAGTVYSKNGMTTPASGLAVGRKVIIVGTLDKTTNILIAKTVKIVK